MQGSNRVVLITGASSGIGLATAYTLAPYASHLFVVGRQPSRLEKVAADLKATPIVADLSDPGQAEQIAEVVRQSAGRLDLLLNCAGQLEVGQAETLGFEVTERLIRVNFLGTVAAIHSCLPLLRNGRNPVIMNVASIAGRIAPPFMAAYAASKFALIGYSNALRQELSPEGIHVGVILPGPVDTPMVHGRLGGPHYPVPPGVPVLSAERVAKVIVQAVEQRTPEVVVPRWLSLPTRLGALVPAVVDRLYSRLNGIGTSKSS